MRQKVFGVVLLALLASFSNVRAQDSLTRREWQVDGLTREALVYTPPGATTKAAPLVFAFHGHGGTMRNAARMYHIHTLWPEAIVVYMQGLNTPGALTDPEGKKPGWQHTIGAQGDRDLKFFDAVLASLKKDYKVDAKRVFSTGHSNGGGFTYLLWAARPDDFAAFAPSAAIARAVIPSDALPALAELEKKLKPNSESGFSRNKKFIPKPALHFAGENDPLVKFEWQRLSILALRKLNQSDDGKPWDKDPRCTIYESKTGAPLVTYIHKGTHAYPQEAPEIIVKFFKAQTGTDK